MIGNYEKSFPRIIDADDPKWSGFIDKLDEYDNYIRAKIEGLDTLLDYDRCPSEYLRQLAVIVYAGLEDWDTDVVKRKKIRDAIRRHKFSSTWNDDCKLAVWNFTGFEPYLYNFRSIAFWVWDADRDLTNNLGWNVSRWSAAREFPNSKVWNADRLRTKGVVYIDVNTDTLTDVQYDQLVVEVKKSVPAFMEIHLGYIDSGGKWVDKEVIYQP